MALKKTARKPFNDIESAPLCFIDRVFYNQAEGQTFGDMYWTFEEAENTLSKDMKRLHNQAVNCIVSDKEEEGFEDSPVYLITRKNDGMILEAVVFENDFDSNAKERLKEQYGSSLKISVVPSHQEYIEVPAEDLSMVQYNIEKIEKEMYIARLLEAVRSRGSGEQIKMASISVLGSTYDSISWHTGLDGDTYFVLGRPDGSTAPGMNEERVFGYLDEAKLDDLSKLVHSMGGKFSSDIEELLYLELTVGGDAIDRDFVYQCVQGYSSEELGSLKTSLQTRLTEFYDDLHRDGHLDDKSHKEALADIDKDINSWLGSWALLAGKMDAQLANYEHKVSEKVVSSIAERGISSNIQHRKNIGLWAKRACENFGLDENKLSPAVRKIFKPLTNIL